MEAPIGSIVAFAGEIDPGFATRTGWMLCDGRSLDANDPTYRPLFDAIQYAWGGDRQRQFFNVPDLAGYFLRGVEEQERSHRDPDGNNRPPNNPGGNAGRRVGSVQEAATAQAKNKLTIEPNGDHAHTLDFK